MLSFPGAGAIVKHPCSGLHGCISVLLAQRAFVDCIDAVATGAAPLSKDLLRPAAGLAQPATRCKAQGPPHGNKSTEANIG